MKIKAVSLLSGVVLFCAGLGMLSAQPAPNDLWRAKHLLGDESAAEIRNGWFEERATYLVRLEGRGLVFQRRQEQLQSATSGDKRSLARPQLESEASRAYLDKLAVQREDMLDRIAGHIGRSITPRFVYALGNNGFAVELTPAEAETVARLDGVTAVHRDHELELHTDAGPEWIGAPAIWNGSAVPAGATAALGEGVVFGIIDTGIAHDNPGFAAEANGYTHANPLGSGNYLGSCAPGGGFEDACNDKLIGMHAYDDLGGDPTDTQSHGSHVASTAAGNPVDLNVGTEVLTIQGVAPRGNIIAYNACCMASTLSAAMEDVITDYDQLNQSADVPMVVNYSIGASVQLSPWERFDGQAFMAMRDAGIFVATSAGNSGWGEATVGTPGVAPWVTTVASSSHNRVLGAAKVSVTGPVPVPAELDGMLGVEGDGPEVQSFEDLSAVFAGDVDPDNDTGCASYSGSPFDQGVAVVRRGECSFQIKVENADTAGAAFVLVVNNEPGQPITMAFAQQPPLPSAMVSQASGETLIDWMQSNPGATLSLEAGQIVRDDSVGDYLSNFSSRGPIRSVPSVIGPDIAAPGSNILGAYASSGGEPGWGLMSGTSMASPHIAGAAGLLFSSGLDWTPGELQSAMMMTAYRDMTDWDGEPANILGMGAGRVDLNRAALAGFVLDETGAAFEAADPESGGDPSTLNLPAFSTDGCDDSCSFTRTLRGTGDPVEYEFNPVMPNGVTVSVTPASFTIQSGETQDIQVDFSGIHSADDRFGWIEFEVVDGSGSPDLHMPVLLDNLYGEISAWLLEVAPGRVGQIGLIRETEDGQEELDTFTQVVGEGFAHFFLFSMEPGVFYPRVEIMIDGYEDMIFDNNGQGWEPEVGQRFEAELLELERLPFGFSATGVSEREKSSLTTGFEVQTNEWPFEYEVVLRMQGEASQSLVDDGTIAEPQATESFSFDLDGLVCGTKYELETRLRHVQDGAEDQVNTMDISTKGCFEGSGDGTFSCSLSDGRTRLDPVVPLMVLMALAGLGLRRRIGLSRR